MSKIANADKSANQKNVNAHKTLFFRKLSITFKNLVRIDAAWMQSSMRIN